jgi:hypothetical protein
MQIIYAHATLALLAVPLGLYIFLTKKGTKQHIEYSDESG